MSMASSNQDILLSTPDTTAPTGRELILKELYAELEELDNELREVMQADQSTRMLRHSLIKQHNQTVPILKLPPSVILEIFRYLSPLAEDVEPNDLDWMNFSFVCSDWRQWALKDCRIWTFLPFGCPEAAMTMIKRAHGMPLYLNMSQCNGVPISSRQLDLLQAAFSAGNNTRALEGTLTVLEFYIVLDYITYNNKSIDSLEHIDIFMDCDGVGGMTGDLLMSPLVTPRLQYLALCNFIWPFAIGQPLLNLTHIDLDNSQAFRDNLENYPKLSFKQALDLLEIDAPNLTNVSFQFALDVMIVDDEFDFQHSRPLIVLPKLSYLKFHDSINEVSQFLRRLKTPNLEKLNVCFAADMDMPVPQDVDNARCLDEIMAVLDQTSRITSLCSRRCSVTNIAVSVEPHDADYLYEDVKLSISRRRRSSGPRGYRMKPGFRLDLRGAVSRHFRDAFVRQISAAFPCDNVREIREETRGDYGQDILYWRLCSSYPSATKLEVVGFDSILSFFAALKATCDNPEEWTDEKGELAFSRVTDIYLKTLVESPPLREIPICELSDVICRRREMGTWQGPMVVVFASQMLHEIPGLEQLEALPNVKCVGFSYD